MIHLTSLYKTNTSTPYYTTTSLVALEGGILYFPGQPVYSQFSLPNNQINQQIIPLQQPGPRELPPARGLAGTLVRVGLRPAGGHPGGQLNIT